MKRDPFFNYLRSIFSPPGLHESLIVQNFHLDLIIPIFTAIDKKVFLIVPDDSFYLLLKYLRPYLNDV